MLMSYINHSVLIDHAPFVQVNSILLLMKWPKMAYGQADFSSI